MITMKCDMSGAAAVVAAVCAIARLKLPVNVTAWAPTAENMPSGTAQRPSDVLKMYSGKTVEVLNTDAEGRLILADALARACEDSPDVLIDAATLTGAAMVALGHRTSAVMSNDDDLRTQVHEVGERTGERMWPMPHAGGTARLAEVLGRRHRQHRRALGRRAVRRDLPARVRHRRA